MRNATLEYDKKYCKIYYYQELNCVCLQWQGFAQVEEFQEACDFSLDLLIKYNASKMIADNTNAKVVSPENQEWLTQTWFPKAYTKGYRTSAVIVSKDLFNEITVKKIVNQMDAGKFEVQFFKNMEDAKSWLASLS